MEAEKEAIEAGKTADEIWPDEPDKARQKNTHARGRSKSAARCHRPDGTPLPMIALSVFVYKSQIGIDRRF